MRNSLIVLVLATSLLVACNKSSFAPAKSGDAAQSSGAVPQSAAAQPNDAVSQKLQELAGSGATDCGRVKSQSPDQTQKASECAMNAAKDKHAFYVAYDMPGLSVGVAGNSGGKLFSVQAEQAEAGAKAEAKSAPCPAELRLAQSGRVTCMTPGSMGGAGGSPHGGMPAATGENPHGGGMMNMPNLGSNPQGTTKPSHPPASKTPPKQ